MDFEDSTAPFTPQIMGVFFYNRVLGLVTVVDGFC